jgi:hypothetical protein
MRERGDEELPSLTPEPQSLLDMPLPLHGDPGSQEARIRGPSAGKIKYLSCENFHSCAGLYALSADVPFLFVP